MKMAFIKSKIFSIIRSNIYHQQYSHYLFNNIVGYDDIKELFERDIMSSNKQIHLLLCGPPAIAKSLFMQQLTKLEKSYFTIGSHSSKSGMVDALFEKQPKYLIVDEIDKMSIKDQSVLLSLMEKGLLQKQSTKELEK